MCAWLSCHTLYNIIGIQRYIYIKIMLTLQIADPQLTCLEYSLRFLGINLEKHKHDKDNIYHIRINTQDTLFSIIFL